MSNLSLFTSPIKTGDVLYSSRTTAPSGYLKCDGSNYAKSSYNTLSTMLGSLPDGFKVWPTITLTAWNNGGVQGGATNGSTIAVASSGGYVAYSTNGGASFTVVGGIMNSNSTITRVRYLNGAFFVCGTDINSTMNTAKSTDGVTWTNGSAHNSISAMYDIAFGAAKYVGVYTSGVSYNSDGLSTWANVSLSGQGASNLTSIAYGASMFVVVGSSGVYSSPDAVTWTQRSTTPAVGVAFGNGIFVVKASIGVVMTSTDGITWVSRAVNLPAGPSFNFIEFSNGVFVISGTVNYYGWLAFSLDGISWSVRIGPQLASTASNFAYVAGVFLVSNNGSTGLFKTTAYTYSTSTNFAVPELQNNAGLTAYIKT